MASIQELKREYTRAVSEGYAAIFAGAGLSRSSGYVNWKDLVRPFADDIGLNVDKEHDLASMTQYYVNKRKTRSSLNQKILNEFTKDVSYNENIDILTRLPIKTYWTTNYDELIEEGLKSNNRKADIKITQESLAINIYDRDAVVYKMHGDVHNPDKAVLIKDDYELYAQERPLFRTALQGELITKTFLFIGFSFDDPNFNYILSQIRVLLGESSRDHYCFFEKVKQQDEQSDEDFHYNIAKQHLKIDDLLRYGIQTIELDSYDEITEILKDIERGCLMKNIFISGSYANNVTSEHWNNEKADIFAFSLAKKLVEHDYKIISGFGVNIGSSVINGALEEIMRSKYKHINEHLCLRPFPQNISDPDQRKKLWKINREEMLKEAGIAIFIFGNKEVNKDGNKEIVNADGMIEEFEIAKETNKIIIPVGSTGWASSYIDKQMEETKGCYKYLYEKTGDWVILKENTDCDKLIDTIIKIISNQQKF